MTMLLKAISDSDTVLMISADALLPQDHGLIQIGAEQITYDNLYMGTLYGCTRGVNSTSAASHAINSPVALVGYYQAPSGGSGTVNSGTQYQLGYYATAGSAISGLTALTASRALASDSNGRPTVSATTATELGYVNGVASAIQTQLNSVVSTANAALPSASFTDAAVTGKLITGFSSGAGTVAGTDTILAAINKLNGNIAAISGGTTATFEMKNRIINGNMRINQRNEGNAVTCLGVNAVYGPDTFFVYTRNQSGQFSMQQQSATPPVGFASYVHIATSTADATPSSSAEYVLSTRMEGFNIEDFNLGTANAAQFTLSFWVRSSLTGTFGGSFENNTATYHAYPFQYTINLADTWEQKTVTLTGDTSGTWTGGATLGMKLLFDLGSGSDFAGTANAWSATGERNHVAGNVQLVSTNAATIDFTGIQVEKGSVATNFEFRSYQTQLALARRYYQKSYKLGVIPGANTGNGPNSNIIATTTAPTGAADTNGSFSLLTTMYTTPTVTFYSPTGTSGKLLWFAGVAATAAERTTSVEDSGPDRIMFYETDNGTDTVAQGHYVAEANIV